MSLSIGDFDLFTFFLCFSFLFSCIICPEPKAGRYFQRLWGSPELHLLWEIAGIIIWEEYPSGVSGRVQSVTTCCCFTFIIIIFSFLSVLPFLRPNIQKSKICTVTIHFAPIEIQNIPANKSLLVVDSCYTRLTLRCPTVRSWAWQECQECYTSHAIHALDP